MPSKVNISIDSLDCLNFSLPSIPVFTDGIDITKVNKEAVNVYNQSCNMINVTSIMNSVNSKVSFNSSGFDFEFAFERGACKTYKFLGMDVDEDFRAVIPTPSGTIPIGYLYDSDKILERIDEDYENSLSTRDIDCIKAVASEVSEEDIRRVATAMKTGKLYEAIKKTPNDKITIDSITDITGILSAKAVRVQDTGFKSITLKVINKKKQEEVDEIGLRADQVAESNYYALYLRSVFSYWIDVMDFYNNIYTTLGLLDLWSDAYKKTNGEQAYYNLMQKATTIQKYDVATGEFTDDPVNVVSFNGIAKNGGIVFTDNVVRRSCSECLVGLRAVMSGNQVETDGDLTELLLGMADTTGIDDIYGLSAEEVQALGIIDSLAFIDEDATLIKDTYDMNDPDDRGLYTKSIIKSYEKNFRDYKPKNDYDVTDTMAELVERSDEENSMVVDMNGNAVVVTDVLTASQSEIDIMNFKQNLIKVLKLLDKSLQRVRKGF